MTQPGDELGAFTQVRLVHHAAVADLFSGLDQTGRPVVMVALTPEAGADAAWRSAFTDLVNRDRASVNPADPQFVAAHAGELQGPRPWVASRFEPGRRGVERILNVIPQAVPPGVDPTAMVGSALFAAGTPAPPPQQAPWAPPGQAPYPGHIQYPGQPPYPGAPVPPQAGPPAAEQFAPPVSAAPQSAPPSNPISSSPYSSPVNSADPTAPPNYGAPQEAPPSFGPPQSAPPAYGAPQSAPPNYGAPQSAPPNYGPPQSGPPSYGAPQSGPPQSGSAGYGGPYFDSNEPNNPPGAYEAAPGDPSNRRGGMLIIGLITAVTALVIVAAGFAVVFIRSGDDKPKTAAAPKPSITESKLPAQTADPSPTPSRSPLPSTTPTLRTNAETISIIGPTWQNEDKVYTMQLPGWPFAFRLPDGWGCLRGTIDELPDANAWQCVKEQGTSHQQRINIMLRRCPTGCTADEQKTMNEAWFDDEEEPNLKKFDATTTYVEIPKNKDGFYAVDMSHFFADKVGGSLTYQVGMWFQSPEKYKDEMQKALNDVRTQAPQPN